MATEAEIPEPISVLKREEESQYLTSGEALPEELKEFKSMLSQPPKTDEHFPKTEHKQIAIGIGAETGNTVSKGNPENSEGESILVSQEFASKETCKTPETCEVDDSQLQAGQEHGGIRESEVIKAMEDGVEKSDPNQYNLDLAGTCLMTTSFGEQNNEGLKDEIMLDQQVEVTAAKDAPMEEGPEAIEPDAAASSPMNNHEATSEITEDAKEELDSPSIDLSSVNETAPEVEEKLVQAPSITIRDEQATTESKCLDNMQGDAAGKGVTGNDPPVEVSDSIATMDEELENFQVKNLLEATSILCGGDKDYEGEDADESNNNVTEEEVHGGPEIMCPTEATKEIIKDNDMFPLPKLIEEGRLESFRDNENKAEKSEQVVDTECVTEEGQNEDIRTESAEEVPDHNIQVDEKDSDKFEGERLEKSEAAAEESIAGETSQTAETPQETLNTSMVRQEDKLQIDYERAEPTEALPEEKRNEEKSIVILAEGSSNDIEQGETEGQNEKKMLENEEDSKILQESEQGEKLEHSLHLTSEEAERIPSEADKIPSLMEGVVQNPEKTLEDDEKVTRAIDNNSIEENDTTKEDLKLDTETSDASKESIIPQQEIKVGGMAVEAFTTAYKQDSQEKTEHEDVMKDVEVNTKEDTEEVHEGAKFEDKEEGTGEQSINDESPNGDASPESIPEESHESLQEAKKEEKMPETEVHEQLETTNTSEDAEKLMLEEEEISDAAGKGTTGNDPSVELSSFISIIDEKVENFEDKNVPEATHLVSGADKDCKGEDAEERNNNITEEEVHDGPEKICPSEASKEILKDNNLLPLPKQAEEERSESFRDDEKKAEKSEQGVDTECVTEGQNEDLRPESAEKVPDQNFQIDEKDADKFEGEKFEKSEAAEGETIAGKTIQTAESPQETLNISMVRQEDKLQTEYKSTDTRETLPEEKGNEKSFVIPAEGSSNEIKQGENEGQNEKKILENEEDLKILQESEQGKKLEHSLHLTSEETERIPSEAEKIPSLFKGVVQNPGKTVEDEEKATGAIDNNSIEENDTTKEDLKLEAETSDASKVSIISEQEIGVGEMEVEPFTKAYKLDSQEKEEYEDVMKDIEVNTKKEEAEEVHEGGKIKDKEEDRGEQYIDDKSQNGDALPESIGEESHESLQGAKNEEKMPEIEVHEKLETTNTSEDAEILTLEEEEISDAAVKGATGNDSSVEVCSSISIIDEKVENFEAKNVLEATPILSGGDKDYKGEDADERNNNITEEEVHDGPEIVYPSEATKEIVKDNNLLPLPKQTEEERFESFRDDQNKEEETEQGDDTEVVTKDGQNEDLRPQSAEEVSDQNFHVDEKDADKFEGEKLEKSEAEAGESIAGETSQTAESPRETLDTSMVRQEDKLQIEYKSNDTTEALPEETGNEEKSFVIPAEGSSNEIKQGETEGQNEKKILEKEEDSKILQESEQGKRLEHSLHLTSEETEGIPSEADKIPSLSKGVVQNPGKTLGDEEKATAAIDNNSIEKNDTTKEDLKLDTETCDSSKESIISKQEVEVGEMEVEAFTMAYEQDSQGKTECEDVVKEKDIEVNTKNEEAEEVHEGAKIEDKEEDTGEQSINDESQNGDASLRSTGEESHESLQEAKKEEKMPEIEVREQLETTNTSEDAEKLTLEEEEISDAASKGATRNDPSVELSSSISIIDEKVENFEVKNVPEATPILSGGDKDCKGEEADERNNNIKEEEVHDGPEIIFPSKATKEIITDNDLLPLPKHKEEERFESCREDENKVEKSEQGDDTECVTKDGQNEDLRPESPEEVPDKNFQVDEKDADKFEGEKLEKSEAAAGESIAGETSQTAESPRETLDTSMARQEDKLQIEYKSTDTTEALPEETESEEKSFVILAEGSSNEIKQGETEGQNEKKILENEEDSMILQESEQGKKLEHSMHLTSEETEKIPLEADKIPCLMEGVVQNPGETLEDEEKVTGAIVNNSFEQNDTAKEDLKLDAEKSDAIKESIFSEPETKVGEMEEEAFTKARKLDSQEKTEYEDVMKDVEVNTKKQQSEEVHDGAKIEDKEEDTEQSIINDESHNEDASPESIEEESHESLQEAKKEEKMPEIEVHEQPETTNASEDVEKLVFEEEEIMKHQSTRLAEKMEEGSDEENVVHTVKEKEENQATHGGEDFDTEKRKDRSSKAGDNSGDNLDVPTRVNNKEEALEKENKEREQEKQVCEADITADSGRSKENLGIEGNDKPDLSSKKDEAVEEITNKDESSPMNLKEEVSDSSLALMRDIEETDSLEETTPQTTEDQPEQKNDHNPLDTTEEEMGEELNWNSSIKSEVCKDTEELLEKERTNFSDTESIAAAKEEPKVKEAEQEDNTEVGGSESDLPLEERGLAATETKGVDQDSVDTSGKEDSTDSVEKDKEIPSAANEMQDETSNSVGEDQKEVTTIVAPLKEILEGDLKENFEAPLEEQGLVSTEAREINETSEKIQDPRETSETHSISLGVEEMLMQKEDSLSNTIAIPLLETVDTGEERVDEIKKHTSEDQDLHTEQSAETCISKTKDAEVSAGEETRDEGAYEKPTDEAVECIEPSGIREDDEKDINKADHPSTNLVGSLKDNTDVENEATGLERSNQTLEINDVSEEASQIEENLELQEFDQKLKHETDSKDEDQSNETILDSSKSRKEENTTDAQNQEAENEKEEENEKVTGAMDNNSIGEYDTTKEDLKVEAETSNASKESIISQQDTRVGEIEVEVDSQEKTGHEDTMKDIEVNAKKEEAEEVHEGTKIEDKEEDTEQSIINDESHIGDASPETIGEELHESRQEAKAEEKMPEIEVHEQLETTTTPENGENLMFVEEEISKHWSAQLTDEMEEGSNEENAVKIITEKEDHQVTHEGEDIDTQKTKYGSSKAADNFDVTTRVTNKEESLEKEDKEREPEKEVLEADMTPDSGTGKENLGIEENDHPDLSSSTKDEVVEETSKEDESSPTYLKEVVSDSSLVIMRSIDETGPVEETTLPTTEGKPEPKNDQYPLNITDEGKEEITLEEIKEDLVQKSSFESEACEDSEELLEKEKTNISYSESIAAAIEETEVKEADPEDNTEVGGSDLPSEEKGLAATETKGADLDSVDTSGKEDSTDSVEKDKEIPSAANEMQDETSNSVGEDQKEVTTIVAPLKEILEGDLKENFEAQLEEHGLVSTEAREINETSEKIQDPRETSETHSISLGVEEMLMQKEDNLSNTIAIPLLETVDTGEERVDEIKKHTGEDQDLHTEQLAETCISKTKDAEVSAGEETRDEGAYEKPTDEAVECIEPSGIREDDEKDINKADNSSTNLEGSLKNNTDVENEATGVERSNQILEINDVSDEASQIEENLEPQEFDQKLKHKTESKEEDQSNETILDSSKSRKEKNTTDAQNQEAENEKEEENEKVTGAMDSNSIGQYDTGKEDLKVEAETFNASKESIISQQDTKVGEMEVEVDSQGKTGHEDTMKDIEVDTKKEEAEEVHEGAKIEDKEEDTEQSIINDETHIGDASPKTIGEELHESLQEAKAEEKMPEIEVHEQLETTTTSDNGENLMFVEEEISQHWSTRLTDKMEAGSNEENAVKIITEKEDHQVTHEGKDIDTQKTKDDNSKAADNFDMTTTVTNKEESLEKEDKEREPEKEVLEADMTPDSGTGKENLGIEQNDHPDLTSSTKDEVVEEISKEDESSPTNLKKAVSDSSLPIMRSIDATGPVEETTLPTTEDKPEPRNDQRPLNITEKGKEEITLEEIKEDLVQNSSFEAEAYKGSEELLEQERTNISYSESIAAAIEETEVKEADPKDNTEVRGSDLPSEEKGLAAAETKGADLDNVDINTVDSTNSFEKDKEIPTAANEIQVETSNSVGEDQKEVSTGVAPLKEILEGDLKENSEAPLEEHVLVSTEAKEINETEKIQDPCETSETHSISPGVEEVLMQKEDNFSNTIAIPLLETVDTGEERVDEIKKHTGEDQDLHTELSAETCISKTKDAEVSAGEETRDEGEYEKPTDEAAVCIEPSGIREDDEKDINEADNSSTNLVGSLKDNTDVEKEATRLERSNQIHDINNVNDERLQMEESLEPDEFDQKLKHEAESIDEDQSNETVLDSNKSQKEENTIDAENQEARNEKEGAMDKNSIEENGTTKEDFKLDAETSHASKESIISQQDTKVGEMEVESFTDAYKLDCQEKTEYENEMKDREVNTKNEEAEEVHEGAKIEDKEEDTEQSIINDESHIGDASPESIVEESHESLEKAKTEKKMPEIEVHEQLETVNTSEDGEKHMFVEEAISKHQSTLLPDKMEEGSNEENAEQTMTEKEENQATHEGEDIDTQKTKDDSSKAGDNFNLPAIVTDKEESLVKENKETEPEKEVCEADITAESRPSKENLGIKENDESDLSASTKDEIVEEISKEDETSPINLKDGVSDSSLAIVRDIEETGSVVETTPQITEDRPEPKNDHSPLDITEEGQEEIILEEMVGDLVQKSSFKSEVCKDTEELVETERTNISDSESIVTAIEETKIKEAEPEDNTKVGGSELPLEEKGLATTETKGVHLDNVDINAKEDSSISFENDEQIPSAANEMQDETSNSVKEVTTKDAPIKEILEDDLKILGASLKEHSSTSTEAKEINETSEKIQDPCETSETQSISPRLEEMLSEKEDNLSNPIADPVLGIVDTGEEGVDEIKKQTGEDDLNTEQSTDTYISKTKDEEISKGKETREEGEHEKPIDEDAKCIGSSGIREDSEKDIDTPDNYSTNLVESLTDNTDMVTEGTELERSNQVHEAQNVNDEASQTEKNLGPEEFDQKLKHIPESMDEDQSNEAILDSNKSQKEEDTIDAQNQEAENEKEEETETKLKSDDPIDKEQNENELSKTVILSEEVGEEVRKVDDGENIKEHVKEEECSRNDFLMASIGDKTMHEVKDYSPISTECVEGAEFTEQMNAESSNMRQDLIIDGEVSLTTKELEEKEHDGNGEMPLTKSVEQGEESEEKINNDITEESDICHNQTDTAPLTTVEADTSLRGSELDDKIENTLNVGSDNSNPETTKSDANQERNEVENEKLEVTSSNLASQISTNECEPQATEDKTDVIERDIGADYIPREQSAKKTDKAEKSPTVENLDATVETSHAVYEPQDKGTEENTETRKSPTEETEGVLESQFVKQDDIAFDKALSEEKSEEELQTPFSRLPSDNKEVGTITIEKGKEEQEEDKEMLETGSSEDFSDAKTTGEVCLRNEEQREPKAVSEEDITVSQIFPAEKSEDKIQTTSSVLPSEEQEYRTANMAGKIEHDQRKEAATLMDKTLEDYSDANKKEEECFQGPTNLETVTGDDITTGQSLTENKSEEQIKTISSAIPFKEQGSEAAVPFEKIEEEETAGTGILEGESPEDSSDAKKTEEIHLQQEEPQELEGDRNYETVAAQSLLVEKSNEQIPAPSSTLPYEEPEHGTPTEVDDTEEEKMKEEEEPTEIGAVTEKEIIAGKVLPAEEPDEKVNTTAVGKEKQKLEDDSHENSSSAVREEIIDGQVLPAEETEENGNSRAVVKEEEKLEAEINEDSSMAVVKHEPIDSQNFAAEKPRQQIQEEKHETMTTAEKIEDDKEEEAEIIEDENADPAENTLDSKSVKDLSMKKDSTEAETVEKNEIASNQTSKEEKSVEESQIAISALPSNEQNCEGATTVENTDGQTFSAKTSEQHAQEEEHEAAITAKELEDNKKEEVAITEDGSTQNDKDSKIMEDLCLQKYHIEPEAVLGDENTADQAPMEEKAEEKIQVAPSALPSKEEEGKGATRVENTDDQSILADKSEQLVQEKDSETGIIGVKMEGNIIEEAETARDRNTEDSSDSKTMKGLCLQKESTEPEAVIESETTDNQTLVEEKSEEQIQIAISALPSNKQECEGADKVEDTDSQTFATEKSEEQLQEEEHKLGMNAKKTEGDKKGEAEIVEDKGAEDASDSNTMKDLCLQKEPIEPEALIENDITADQAIMKEKSEEQIQTAISALHSKEEFEDAITVDNMDGETFPAEKSEQQLQEEGHEAVIIGKIEDNKKEQAETIEDLSAGDASDSKTMKDLCPQKQSTKPEAIIENEIPADQTAVKEKSEEEIQIANSALPSKEMEIEGATTVENFEEQKINETQILEDENQENSLDAKEAEGVLLGKGMLQELEAVRKKEIVSSQKREEAEILEGESAEDASDAKTMRDLCLQKESTELEAPLENKITVDPTVVEEKQEEKIQIATPESPSKELECRGATTVENIEEEKTKEAEILQDENREDLFDAEKAEDILLQNERLQESEAVRKDEIESAQTLLTEKQLPIASSTMSSEEQEHGSTSKINEEEKMQEEMLEKDSTAGKPKEKGAEDISLAKERLQELEIVGKDEITFSHAPMKKLEEKIQTPSSALPLEEEELGTTTCSEELGEEKLKEEEVLERELSELKSMEDKFSQKEGPKELEDVLEEEIIAEQALPAEESWENETKRAVQKLQEQNVKQEEKLEDESCENPSVGTKTKVACFQMEESNKLEAVAKDEIAAGHTFSAEHSEELQISAPALSLEDKWKTIEGDEPKKNGDPKEIMEDEEVAQTFHQTSLSEESVKVSDQEEQLKALGDENNATFKTTTNRIPNEEPLEETQKVNANKNDEEIQAEDRSIEEPDNASSVVMTETTTVRKEESAVAISQKGSTKGLGEAIEIIHDVQQIEKTANELSYKQIPSKVDLVESTGTMASTGNKHAPLEKQDVVAETFKTAEVRDLEPGNAKGIYAETKEAEVGEEAKTDNYDDKATEQPTSIEEISLANLLQKSRKETLQMAKEMTEARHPTASKEELKVEEAETIQVKEAKINEEKGDREEGNKHEKMDSDPDSPITVKATREINVKVPHKKSHNILSGVGSKVKHSISKVKKAFSCASPHEETSKLSENPDEHRY